MSILTKVEQPLSEEVLLSITNLPLQMQTDHVSGYYSHSETFHAIDKAAKWLRYMPDQPMLDTPVYLSDDQLGDPGSRMLATMINGSISKPTIDPETPAFKTEEPRGIEVCIEAEGNFVLALDELRKGPDRLARADVIMHEGVPVMLRKAVGAVTCLTLCEIAVNGIPFPAGTIVRADLPMSAFNREQATRVGRAFNIFQSQDLTSVGVLRLSTFVYPEEQRREWEAQDGRIKEPTADIPLEEVTERVTRAVKPFVIIDAHDRA